MVGLTLWKWILLKMVGHILISPNKGINVEESILNILMHYINSLLVLSIIASIKVTNQIQNVN